jgi:uncharacterized BrkB/YihY/UPF0761 family membrane protein
MSRMVITLIIGPFIIYFALGIASAVFSWASNRATPWWHRYLACVLLAVVAIHVGEGGR